MRKNPEDPLWPEFFIQFFLPSMLHQRKLHPEKVNGFIRFNGFDMI
jgi:hypothetical protein